LNEQELEDIIKQLEVNPLQHLHVKGLMGMASFSDNTNVVRNEFKYLKQLYDLYKNVAHAEFSILSMGMSGDYQIAIEEGSNMVRIGSLLFGARN
jgi:PLP dependent protein